MWGRIYPHAVLLIFANILLQASCKGKGSLTYVIDDTGSMYDDISIVRHSVNRISNVVFNEKASVIENMVLVTFNDPEATVRANTTDRSIFKNRLDAVYAHGGGHCPEPSMKGLLLGLETSNRDSYIYVFTDASAKDYRDGRYVKEMCQKKQSQIVFVLTGRCRDYYSNEPFDVYFDIAHACSGQAFYVPKKNVDEVLRTIEVTIRGNKTIITTAMVPAGVKKDIPFTIDDHTDYAIVSASGINVYLDIKGPSATSERIMWTNNGKVVKLSNIKPGTYVATVGGQTKTSVIIVGRTDFFFTHGFSKQKPKSPGDTSLQPIAETNVHLSISVTDDHHSVKIVSAQILDMNEKLIKELPLTKISNNFYVTNLFVAPSHMFKVAVNGIVKVTGKKIKRIGKIPITPQEPPKKLPDNTRPTVEISEGKAIEIEYDSTVKLTCNVVAFPKPTIKWANQKGVIMPSKMSLVEYPYRYISYMDISHASKGDTYKCHASNDVGRDQKTINVIVKDAFTVKSVPSETTKVVYGTEGTITCDITSHLPMEIHWYYNNDITGQAREIETSDKYEVSASRTQLKIKKMDFDLVGKYACKVSLKNKKEVQKSFSTRVTIGGLIAPKVQGVTTLKVTKGKTAVFECKVLSGVPAPKITWQYMDKSAAKSIPDSGTTLRIINAEKKDAGRYKCVAQNKVGSDEHITTLIVEYSPVITTKSTTVEGIEGDLALRIPCDVDGIPKPVITWKLKGARITPGAKYLVEGGALVIMNPKKKDTASYTCEAKNHIGSVSVTFQAKVDKLPDNTRPTVEISEGKAIEIEYDSTVKLTCNVVAFPKPTIKWANQKGVIMPSKMSLVEYPYRYISYMDISHASKGDTYKCHASNDVGRDQKTINVIVKDAFTVKSVPSETTKVVYGTEGTITCDITSHLPMEIHWYYNNDITGQAREIETSDKYEVSASRTQLKIKKMDFDLVGKYACKVSLKNKKEVQKSFSTRVTIGGLIAPKVQGVTTLKVTKGKTAVFECKVLSGVPAPKITWQYMDKSAAKSIPDSGTTLRIINAEKKDAGRYKCVAQNKVGSDEHITTLIVEYSPVITTKSTTVEGIEGDLALRIPCDVDGIPKPVITWKLKGARITPGAKYLVVGGALVIMNPKKKDTASYTCEAKNHIGSVSVTFQAKVDKFPKSFDTIHNVYLKQGETKKLKCPAYNSPSQKVKWFITQDGGNKEYIQIANASPSEHDGNYTCHVSDKHGNTQTHVYVVDVGFAPEFTSGDNSISNWEGDITDIIRNCDTKRTKPIPVVQWRLNGKALTDLNSAGVGHYTCNVTNVHGSILKQFDVKSSVCLITRNLRDAQYMPLVLNDEGFWHKLATTEHYMIVKQEDKITLACPSQKETSNTFKNFPKKSTLKAICYKEDSFLVEDKIYKLSDLQCTSSIQPSVIRKKVNCLTKTSELIRVGYNVPGFLEAYEVCFDTKINMPLYTRIIMTDANDNGVSARYNWYTYPRIGHKQTERGFTCKDASSSCCYSKSQLVNAIDFNDGPAKKSTFIDPLNAIPVWLPCGKPSKWSWEVVNDKVRSQLDDYENIVVWSGTHTWQNKNGATIPRYLWKVVRLESNQELAIIHVNDPKPTESDIKCKSPLICNKYENWTVNGTSTYCCSLPDFLKSFDIHNTDIGESMEAVLDKMKKT